MKKQMRYELTDEAVERLAEAAALQAAEDYREALQNLKINPEHEEARAMQKDCERFFSSSWFRMLTEVDGKVICKAIREEELGKMKAKEFFSQARELDDQLDRELEKLSALKALAAKTAAALEADAQNPDRSPDTLYKLLKRVGRLQQNINDDTARLIDLKEEYENLISQLEKPEHRRVLELRYLCGWSWEKIAMKMSYSVHHVYKVHRAAMSACDRLLAK